MAPATLLRGAGAGDDVARVTLQTIADELGVSRMTVSNAFNRPDQLSADLRARILERAERLGYVGPDPSARALVRGQTGVVGVLLTDTPHDAFNDEVSTGFLAGVTEHLAPTGLSLTLLHAAGTEGFVPARDVAMDAAIVYACAYHHEAIDWLIRRKLPLVIVDREPMPDIESVTVDDRGGARAAAQHLVDLGHRRIATISPHVDAPYGTADPMSFAGDSKVVRQRLLGWNDALGQAGITPITFGLPEYRHVDGEDLARRIFDLDPRPTAVLCHADTQALGVLRVAAEVGLRVPEDVSVVGFDGTRAAAAAHPPLTTIVQDQRDKGGLVVQALQHAMARIRDGSGQDPVHLVLHTNLVVRGSTAPPPA